MELYRVAKHVLKRDIGTHPYPRAIHHHRKRARMCEHLSLSLVIGRRFDSRLPLRLVISSPPHKLGIFFPLLPIFFQMEWENFVLQLLQLRRIILSLITQMSQYFFLPNMFGGFKICFILVRDVKFGVYFRDWHRDFKLQLKAGRGCWYVAAASATELECTITHAR